MKGPFYGGWKGLFVCFCERYLNTSMCTKEQHQYLVPPHFKYCVIKINNPMALHNLLSFSLKLCNSREKYPPICELSQCGHTIEMKGPYSKKMASQSSLETCLQIINLHNNHWTVSLSINIQWKDKTKLKKRRSEEREKRYVHQGSKDAECWKCILIFKQQINT